MRLYSNEGLQRFLEKIGWPAYSDYASITRASDNMLDFPVPQGLNVRVGNQASHKFLNGFGLAIKDGSEGVKSFLSYAFTSVDIDMPTSLRKNVALGRKLVDIRSVCEPFRLPTMPYMNRKPTSRVTKHVRKTKDISDASVVSQESRKMSSGLQDDAQIVSESQERPEPFLETVKYVPSEAVQDEFVDPKGSSCGSEPAYRTSNDYFLFGALDMPAYIVEGLYVQRLSPELLILASGILTPTRYPDQETFALFSDPDAIALSTETSPAALTAAAELKALRESDFEVTLVQDTGKWNVSYSYALGDSMLGLTGLYHFDTDKKKDVTDGIFSNGRWSVGGEAYLSTLESGAGLSAGARFASLPENEDEPPRVLTMILNPIIGSLSLAYNIATGPLASMSSRIDTNVFSYEADLTVGGELFRRRTRHVTEDWEDLTPRPPDVVFSQAELSAYEASLKDKQSNGTTVVDETTVNVFKYRVSTTADFALSWEGTWRSLLFSVGVLGDLRKFFDGWGNPLKSIGISVELWR